MIMHFNVISETRIVVFLCESIFIMYLSFATLLSLPAEI